MIVGLRFYGSLSGGNNAIVSLSLPRAGPAAGTNEGKDTSEYLYVRVIRARYPAVSLYRSRFFPAFRLAMYRLYSNVNSLNSGKRAIASNTAAVPHVQSEIVGRGATCDSRVFTCRMCPQDFFAKCLDLGVTKGAAST